MGNYLDDLEKKTEEKKKKGSYYSFLEEKTEETAGEKVAEEPEKKDEKDNGEGKVSAGVKLDLFAAKKGKVEPELFFVKKPKKTLADILQADAESSAYTASKPEIKIELKTEKIGAEDLGGIAIFKTLEKAKAAEKQIKEAEVLELGESFKVVRARGEKLLTYVAFGPSFTDEEKKLMGEIEKKAIAQLDIEAEAIASYGEKKKIFTEKVRDFIEKNYTGVEKKNLSGFTKLIVQDMIGYGSLDPLINDDALEEIMLVGRNIPVFVYHRKHGMCKTNIIFEDDEEAVKIINRIARAVGRRVDASTPLLDARLKDGSRVNATVPPISLDGPTLTIRKFKADPFTLVDILNFRTMSIDLVAFLWLAVEGFDVKPANILISGGTGSGKTTTLNCVGSFIPSSNRVISIEDTAELQIPVKHWVRLETRPPNLEGKGEISMEVLLKNTLRMRPDRIIVGEVRGKEASTLLAAMNTGQSGCMGTLHANNARETITRLTNAPMSVPLIMIPALNIIVMQNRFSYKGKTVRRITEVAEVSGIEKKEIMINNIFEWDPKTDTVVPTGAPSKIKHRLAELRGVSIADIEAEIERRKKIIEWMVKTNVKGIKNVGMIINEYNVNKDRLLAKVEGREYKEDEKEGKKDKKEAAAIGIVKLFDTEATEKEVLERHEYGQLVKYPTEKNPVYEVFLPKTTKEERRALREIENKAIEKISIDPAKIEDRKEAEKIFSDVIAKMIKEKFSSSGSARVKELTRIVVNSLIGFSYLEPLMKDDELEEIMVIGTEKSVYVNHSKFGICRTNISFDEDKETEHIIEKIATSVGRRIDKSTPLLDARLKDGSRANATIPPISVEGPTLTIRKFKPDPYTIIDLINFKTITLEVAAYFWLAVEGWGIKPANILIAGGSGCGKTTLLNSFCMFVPDTQRLISIEDTAELRIPAKHWLRLETKPPSVEGTGEVTMDDLVKNTLRMRPDRVLVGEVRGNEARTLFTAMNTGHDGCMGTLHSNSARETVTKLVNPPMNVPPIMLPALDIVVMEQKIYYEGQTLRRITEVAEITEASGGGDDETVTLNTVYQWNPKKDLVEPTGVPSVLKQRLAKLKGMDIKEIDTEIERRKRILEHLVKKKTRRLDAVAAIVQRYYAEGEELLKEMEEDTIKAAKA